MTITKEETAMNTAISEYASVGTSTGLAVPTPATTPTTMKGAATTEAAKSQRQVPARIGRAQLQAIAERLDTTDRELLALLAAHRYATTRQLAQITELSGQYGSARSALRQTSRRLRRQHGLGLVDHLARRIGGTRAGSAGYVWYLTAAGQRLTSEGQGRGARRRFQEPSPLFLAHTLAITQARVVIEQAIHAVGGHLARLRTEPACWRSWLRLGGALGWLKPDLEAITATDTGAEDHWLFEVDLDTEHPGRLLAKCHDYQAHLASGTFQAQHGYYPQVVWLLTNPTRAGRLAEQIAADQTLTPGLFKITAAPEQLAALIQRGP
ncbi:replication-relaxation family protein [Actinomyces oris]|uniref:replication-relaxation family protein n=1 Tax=Actinomyces TaxID=1654 RepID=UPI0021000BA8|nr:replication-relaxation family protein [Actinomyces oris]